MSWTPDADLERLVTTALAHRREAMTERQIKNKEALHGDLIRRNLFNSGARYTGEYKIQSDAFDEFAQAAIDDVLGLFRNIYGEIPVDAAPWIRARLTETFDQLSKAIVAAAAETARRQNINVQPEPPVAALMRARRRLDLELGTLELKAKLRQLTPPVRSPGTSGSAADIFISHASEDKGAIARPLAEALRARGYTVWIDESELTIGDTLLDKIDEGLARCRFGVVILSPNFFGKKWTRRELAGLVARQDAEERKIILPVWHDVNQRTVAQHLPSLAGRLAARMADGIESVVAAIVAAAGPPADTR